MGSYRDARRGRRRRWPWVAAGTAVALLATGGAAYAGARKNVTLDVAGDAVHVSTFGGTVASLLASHHVEVGPHDTVTPAPGSRLHRGEIVQVGYGRQVTADIDGTITTVWTTALDARGALADLASRGGDVSLVASRSQGAGRSALPPEVAGSGPVAVIADGTTHVVRDASISVDTVLADLGITIGPHDRVLVEQRAGTPSLALVVQRSGAAPGAQAKAASAASSARATPATHAVRRARPQASQVQATPRPAAPSPTAPLPAATRPTVAPQRPAPIPRPTPSTTTHDVTTASAVPFATQQIKAPDLPKGLIVVKYHGRAGKVARTYEVTTKRGVEISRRLVRTRTTSRPTDTVILVGTMPPPASSPDPAPAPVVASPSSAQAIARSMVARRGWSSAQFSCLVSLWNNESGWHVTATNRSSGAYGIPQALPATKMASVGADWRTDATTQITWGLDYIAQRYGTPCGAWDHELSSDWY
jgi:uncharacterized protein YabE (DUF348 family)